jgi:hypothetical protein
MFLVARGQGLPLSKEIPFNTLRARVPADCRKWKVILANF